MGAKGQGPRVEEYKHPFENTQNSFSCVSPLLWSILSGPILEIRACIQFFRKKGQNIGKFGQKFTKFENVLKKDRYDYCMQ